MHSLNTLRIYTDIRESMCVCATLRTRVCVCVFFGAYGSSIYAEHSSGCCVFCPCVCYLLAWVWVHVCVSECECVCVCVWECVCSWTHSLSVRWIHCLDYLAPRNRLSVFLTMLPTVANHTRSVWSSSTSTIPSEWLLSTRFFAVSFSWIVVQMYCCINLLRNIWRWNNFRQSSQQFVLQQ